MLRGMSSGHGRCKGASCLPTRTRKATKRLYIRSSRRKKALMNVGMKLAHALFCPRLRGIPFFSTVISISLLSRGFRFPPPPFSSLFLAWHRCDQFLALPSLIYAAIVSKVASLWSRCLTCRPCPVCFMKITSLSLPMS